MVPLDRFVKVTAVLRKLYSSICRAVVPIVNIRTKFRSFLSDAITHNDYASMGAVTR